MNEDEKKRIREEIEVRIQKNKKVIESLKEQAKPVEPDRAIGRITRQDAIQQSKMSESNLRAAEELGIVLEEALCKLDEPGFGVCIRCQKNIPLERILIVPESKCCVNCA